VKLSSLTMRTNVYPTTVGFMAYQYKHVWAKDADIESKLDEWSAAGWELHCATAVVMGTGAYGVSYQCLYFRMER
jgi:hypothetical protein